MKKSPFSTPRGYGGHRKYPHQMNSPYENKGYFYHRNNSFDNSSPKFNSKQVENGDFIPFNTSSPSFHDKRHSGQFFRPRGRRNNHSFGSQGSRGDSMSPKIYFDSSPNNYYGRSPRHRFSNTPIDQIPISKFIDLKDVLDDPWKNLMENHNKSRLTNNLNASKISCASDLNDVSMVSVDNSALEDSSRCSQEMKDGRTNAINDLNTSEIVETNEMR
ncbi:uncharacterized protein [Chelonus insularis]|uniref:uncharacterized protein n=1 Tax=Chelonus insularis TaxID=460826 RepID=UPI00158E27A0|nr:uncharacterized protein LOC118068643 [Chelonus insularis]